MTARIIFNREPYDATDVTWDGLCLAGTLLGSGQQVGLFSMNDSVDMVYDVCKPLEAMTWRHRSLTATGLLLSKSALA